MRLLIVDDDAPFGRMLAEQLEKIEPSMAASAVATADAARQAVQSAAAPFDAFLLDHRLDGSDVDGVTLMQELLQTSRDSAAIVCTGYDDVATQQAASQAGAYWYLAKPFQTWDVVHILRQLQQRNFLRILNSVTGDMQGTVAVQDAADVIVRGGLRFGFRRARLRLFAQEGQEANDDPEMAGVSQAGTLRVDGFEGLRMPLSRLLYSQQAINAGKSQFFKGRELGPGGADEFYAAHGVQPPAGEWVKIPLLSGQRRMGTLTLDNAEQDHTFSLPQRTQLSQVLDLFGQQAAAALDRARLHEQAKRQAEEAEILNAIGRQVMAAAVQGDLNDLLDEVRSQLRKLMDVTNFMVVLTDLETNALDFRVQYEEGEEEPRDRHWRSTDAGLSGYVVTSNTAVLTDDTDAFRLQHGIRQYGRRAECWLGAPLRVEDKAIGALVVQDYQRKTTYTERHRHQLGLVADQVAGAIQMAYRLERQAEVDQCDQALKELQRALPQLPQEMDFWHAVLTTITHHDGGSFNRAALFWYSETGTTMQGRMGIGHFSRQDACRTWEEDKRANVALSGYFAAPQRARLRPTPLEQQIVQWRLKTRAPQGPCYEVWAQGKRQVILSAALRGCLPDDLLQPPDLLDDATEYWCALLPVKSQNGVLGLLVVDNAFDGEPLRPRDLDKLEELLKEVMQPWLQAREANQAERLGETYDQVLVLGHRIRALAADGQIKAALEVLCSEAQRLTQANCVVIYPYHPSSGGYDLSLVSHVGLDQPEDFQVKAKPRQHGVTFSILRSGMLVVPDVERSDLSFGGRKLSEHAFLQRQRINALIGVPLRAQASGEPLGVIYLDYHSAQKFDPRRIALAEHIAAVGADAISYDRAIERAGEGQAAAEAREQRWQRDMLLLANIQAQALASDSDQDKVVRSILQNAAEMFGRPAKATLALLSWQADGEENRQVRRDWRIDKRGHLRSRCVDIGQGPIGEALQQSQICSSENRLAMPIVFGEKTLAALMVRRPGPRASFDLVELEAAERLAVVAALALDSIRTRAYLQTVSLTVSAVSDPKALKETLDTIVRAACQVAPDIDSVNLWYEDLETGELVAGPQWPVTQDQYKSENAPTNRLVRAVMKRQTPIFAPVVERDAVLWGDFTREEGITSAAAFPLYFGARQQALGALFLNYRKAHEFSPVERTLFPIFANAAATAIHSVQTIDLAERRRERLQTALDVVTSAGASLDRDEVLRGVLNVLREAFPRSLEDDPRPYIMLYDERDRVLELPEVARELYQPDKPEYQYRIQLSLDEKRREGQKRENLGITVRVARQALKAGKVVVDNVKDVLADPDYVEVNSKTKSELCAGLVSGERLLGVLVTKSDRLAAFDQEEEKLFEMAAKQVAIALDRVEATRQRVIDTKRLAVLAWRSEIAHEVRRSLNALSSIRVWFDSYLSANAEDPVPGASKCHELVSKSLSEFGKMLSTDLSTSSELKLSELMGQIGSWVEDKKADAREWQSVSFEWPVSDPDVTMSCDRLFLCRSLQIIITNSVEAITGKELGRIGLYVQQASDNAVEIEIWDNGSGFPDEIYSRVGQDTWSDKKGEGRGFGLYNATLFLEIMRGSLELRRPVPGSSSNGARVVVRVPLVKKPLSC